MATATSTHSFAASRSVPGTIPTVVAAGGLRASGGRGHDLAESAGDDRGAALGEQPPDLLRGRLGVRAAPDHRDLQGHAGTLSRGRASRAESAQTRHRLARTSPVPSKAGGGWFTPLPGWGARVANPSKRDNGGMSAPRQARGGTLIVGGGFAGGYVARLLGKRGATIVSRENFMLYTPLLPEAAAGNPRAAPCRRPAADDVPARRADPRLGDRRSTPRRARSPSRRTPATQQIGYERLVISAGAVARTLPIPGLADHGLGFKDLADAIALRNHVLHRLTWRRPRPTPTRSAATSRFVFVGAGYAGVEALAELSDLVRGTMRYYPELRKAPAALGARGRGAGDPLGDPEPPGRVRGP